MIVDVVAKLIEANQKMHEKLASTEKKLHEQAQKIQAHAAEARTDSLTLLMNRRAFDDELVRRCAEASRQGRIFSLIMADVDYFKELNDSHGHQTGDEILRGVARLLRRKMRDMDLVARYGGEEFAVILPGTNLKDAEIVALRACEGVEKSPFSHEGKEIRISMSFGVAEIKSREDGVALVSRADKALYAAKEGGRTCVYLHDGETIRRAVNEKPPTASKISALPSCHSLPDAERSFENGSSSCGIFGCEISTNQPAIFRNSVISPNIQSRAEFCQQIKSRAAEWKRGGPIFSVALIEVNCYDSCGEHCGSNEREVATIEAGNFLTATVREMDVVGFYAPCSFAILLPTAELVSAIRLAERLREGFSLASSVGKSENSRLTLSVGVAQIMENDDCVSLLKRAEAALDASDRRGGNSSYYHDGERCAPITAMLETMDYLA
jgi:diguanylate cyclase